MDEGNDNNQEIQENVPEESTMTQDAPHHEPTGHTELELVFVLILIGLLGIAAFIGYNFIGDFRIDKPAPDQMNGEITNETMNGSNYSDVPGRDKSKLGLAIHETKGRHYTHPVSGMTLYVNGQPNCDERCQKFFVPNIVDGEHVKTPKGNLTYTYINDPNPGIISADGFDSIWQIARP